MVDGKVGRVVDSPPVDTLGADPSTGDVFGVGGGGSTIEVIAPMP